jgi:hypothetical protein
MPDKFKKGDVVYFKHKGYTPSWEYPIKGTKYGALGLITKIEYSINTVLWAYGHEYEYTDDVLRHKHRIIMFVRYLLDHVKDAASDVRNEISTYLKYRKFKKGDTVCLRQSTDSRSTCEIGVIDRKSFPAIVVEWPTNSSYESILTIEHCSGIDPNRLFQSYKRNIS